ncbi:MAG: hypothetical protein M1832_001439 [Thelocarpon impressellum]|nr:MAG: hypothetical protein M1832_001439 [Thelocarpon impressellum]
MPRASWAALPPELVLAVLEAADSLRTASALSRTCRAVHDVWRSNRGSICRAVLPRSLPCSAEAERLAQVQELLASRAASGPGEDSGHPARDADPAFAHSRRLLDNAHTAHLVRNLFVANCVTPFARVIYPDPDRLRAFSSCLSPSENVRFTRAYYLLWTAAIDDDRRLLRSLSLRELWRMLELSEWLASVTHEPYRLRLCFASVNLTPHTVSAYERVEPGMRRWWAAAREMMLEAFHARSEEAGGPLPGIPNHAPEGRFALFDEFQSYVEMLPEGA